MTTNTRSIIIWVSALALLAAGITWVLWPSSAKLDPNASTLTEIFDSDWVTGNRESEVVLIEYSDFQCPACAFYHPIMQSIMKEFGDRIQFAYRHFPLKSRHANAERAAFAAEAAGKQGKFWEMQSLLFERQGDWKESNDIKAIFESYANSLFLDIEQFRSDFSSDAVEEKVDRDSESALALDVNSTPTFFLNGRKIKSPLGYDALRSLIQNALDGTL